MRAKEFIVETAMMGKIADSGKIIRILKKAHTVPFSDEKNWLLVDMDPAKGNKGLGIKWIPADTRFEWVRPYRDNVEQDVAEDTLNEFDYNKHVKMLNAYMKKLGYSYIGHGTDAHVFSKEAGSVTKVLIPKSGDISTAKNPFLAFLNYCKKNAGNPHLPKFTETTKEPIQLGSEKFDQVVMERLQEVDPKYEDLLVSITDSIEDGKPLDPQYQPYIKFYQTLKSVMLTGRKLGFENDIITFQSVNIMQRGNTLVIIDPWTGKGQQGVAEGLASTLVSKIFFARSNKTPKGWSYDHVGFITQDGKQIQMSGHRGNDVYITNAVTDDPEFLKQNIKIMSLPKPVSVPTTNTVGAENCGTFVANVLQANGVKGIDTQKIYSVFKKPPEQTLPENFADGRNPQDKGDAKRHGVNTKGSVSSLRKVAKQGGRKGQLAHWMANMKAGRAKK